MKRPHLLILAAALLSASTSSAQTIRTWTGAGWAWHTPTNWTPIGVPEFTDTVIVGANANITIDGPVSIGGTLRWVGGTAFTGNQGTIGLNVAPGGTLEILGPFEFSGQLTNAGTIVITNDAWLHLKPYSRLRNLANGVVRLASNDELRAYDLNAWIDNHGLLLKEGAGTRSRVRGTFHQFGTVEARAGALVGNDRWRGYDGCRYLGAGTIRMQGLLQDGAFSSSNLWIEGSLQGTNTLSGELHLPQGARIDSAGGVSFTTVAPDGRLVIAGDVTFSTARITNSGVLDLSGDLNLAVEYRSTIVNLPAGVIRAEGSHRLTQWSSPNRFVNLGSFIKVGGAGATKIELPFDNHGVLEARNGVVDLGNFFTAHDGSQFLGAGTNRVGSGMNIAGPIISSNLWLVSGGSMQGTGSVAGVMHWSGGTLGQPAPNGPLTLATNCALHVVGDDDRWLSGLVTNAGRIVVEDGSWFGFNRAGSRLVNLPSALFELTGDGRVATYEAGTILENRGTLIKSGGAGSALLSYGVTLENSGMVDIRSGKMDVAGTFRALAGSRLMGPTEVRNGSYLVLGNTFADDLMLVSGAARGTGAFSGTLRWNSGGYLGPFTLASNSTLEVIEQATHNLQASLTNAGTITLRDNASLVVDHGLVNLPGGVIDIQSDNRLFSNGSGAVVENRGVVRRSSGTGQALLSGSFTFANAGQVEIQSGILRFQTTLRAEANSRFEGPIEFSGNVFHLAGDCFADDLRLLGGNSVHGPGRFSGLARWSGGSVAGQGGFSVNTNGVLELTGNGTLSPNRWLTNAGVIRLSDSAKISFNGANSGLMNLPGALVELTGANHFYASDTRQRFVNHGIVRSSAAGTTTFGNLLSLENAGIIDCARGRITLPGDNYVDAGGILQVKMFASANSSIIGFRQPLFLPMARLAGTLDSGYIPLPGTQFQAFDKLAVALGSIAVTNLPAEYIWRFDSTLSASDVPVGTMITMISPAVVETAPRILTQPRDLAAFAGSTVAFSVVVEGSTPLGYQWRFNDSPLLGATSAVFSLTNVQPGHSGTYIVTVTNAAGSVASAPASLAVVEFRAGSRMTPEGFWITLPTLTGARFRVEASSNLQTDSWETIGAVLDGDGTVMEVLDAGATSVPWRFYRVRRIP